MKKNYDPSLNHEKKKKGFLRVPHALLDDFFSSNLYRHQLALIHLCVLRYIFYKDAYVHINGRNYMCRQGEWLTSTRKIADLTRVNRNRIQDLLALLADLGIIVLETTNLYTRIRLIDFQLPEKQPARYFPPKKPVIDHVYIPQYTLHRKKNE